MLLVKKRVVSFLVLIAGLALFAWGVVVAAFVAAFIVSQF